MNTQESTSTPFRVAYLLADAGIQFYSSRKGSSIHARSMIKALTQEGCAVAAYVFRKGDRTIPGFNVSPVRLSRLTAWWQKRMLRDRLWRRFWPWGGQDSPPNWAIAASWLLWHRDLARYVAHQFRKNGRPDLIYARHAWLDFPYARLKKKFGVPLVLEVNAVLTIEKAARREMAFYRLTRWIERRAFAAADLILPVSQELKDQIVSFGIAPEKVVVTPNAVDLELFHPRAEGEGCAGEGFTIGTVNSFKAYHGMATLIEAAGLLKGRIPGLKLMMIGDGEELAGLKAKAAALGLGGIAEFAGTVEHERVPALLRRCDVCAAPYQGPHNQYNCPMKLYEYMALKVPIVAAAWGDIPNIIEDGRTALLHEPGNPQSLAARLEEVWRDPPAAARRAAAAFELAQGHTWRAAARSILNWHAQHHTRENKR